MLDNVGALLRVVVLENRRGDPSRDLAKVSPVAAGREGHTPLLMSIIAEMLGASDPYSLGHALPRHSWGVMRENSRPSMIVSCRASSSGSMSINLSLRKPRGMSDTGSGPGARLPTCLGPAPLS